MKFKFYFLLIILPALSNAQNIEVNRKYENISYTGDKDIRFKVNLKKNNSYLITVFQHKIDVEVILLGPDGKEEQRTDLADEDSGYDKIDFIAKQDGEYQVKVQAFDQKVFPEGVINVSISEYTKKQLSRRKIIQDSLRIENNKSVQVLDVKHFWEAFHQLSQCKTFQDSVRIVQTLYLDRGTNGLKEFARARDFSAEMFVKRIGKYKKYYSSIRQNSLVVYQVSGSIDGITQRFKAIYPDLKAFKVAFVIGPMLSPGTISSNFVLIGSEMQVAYKTADLSEIVNPNLKSDILLTNSLEEVKTKLEETVAHELVHLQQKEKSKQACSCPLLEKVIKEGVAEFIAEKNLSLPLRMTRSRVYGQQNEKILWEELKNELCSGKTSNWLYNSTASKERPGDLGYFIGYKIASSYYEQAADEQRALVEMIEMDNPLLFLDKSKYDLKFQVATGK